MLVKPLDHPLLGRIGSLYTLVGLGGLVIGVLKTIGVLALVGSDPVGVGLILVSGALLAFGLIRGGKESKRPAPTRNERKATSDLTPAGQLKGRYEAGRELQTRLVWVGGRDTPEEQVEADKRAKRKACQWAKETWQVLDEHFKAHEREFYGPGDRAVGQAMFFLSCDEEIVQLHSVDAYLSRKLEFITDLLRRYDQ